MKNVKFIFRILLCLLLLTSCSILFKTPEDGIWYCNELGMAIDFALAYDKPSEAVKVYDDNGESKVYICHLGYDHAICIEDPETGEHYLCAYAEYDEKNQVLNTRTKKDDIKYVFKRYETIEEIFPNMQSSDKSSNSSTVDEISQEASLTQYDENQLHEIANFSGKLSELDAKYPIKSLTKLGIGSRFSYWGNECVCVILFDESDNKIISKIHSAKLLKADFECVSVGETLDDIKKINSNGEYLFLETGRNDAPRISSHYTKDGYLITIEYDNSNVVSNITEEMI